jgi:hypothetical protein
MTIDGSYQFRCDGKHVIGLSNLKGSEGNHPTSFLSSDVVYTNGYILITRVPFTPPSGWPELWASNIELAGSCFRS